MSPRIYLREPKANQQLKGDVYHQCVQMEKAQVKMRKPREGMRWKIEKERSVMNGI